MPKVRRSRPLAAAPDEVWRTVGDPHQLARWWPRVLRVEAVRGERFTEVLQTDRGRDVRADWTFTDLAPGERWRAQQELEGTPFANALKHAEKAVELQPAGAGGTIVTVELDRRMAGAYRMSGPFMKRASARQIDTALDTLEDLFGALRVT